MPLVTVRVSFIAEGIAFTYEKTTLGIYCRWEEKQEKKSFVRFYKGS